MLILLADGPRARHGTGLEIYWPPSTGAPLIYIECWLNGPNHFGRWRAACFKRMGVSKCPPFTSDNKYYVNLLPPMWIDRSGPVPRRVRVVPATLFGREHAPREKFPRHYHAPR